MRREDDSTVLPIHHESPSGTPDRIRRISACQRSLDSEHDVPTAINTPWLRTPHGSTGDLGGLRSEQDSKNADKGERADVEGLDLEVGLREDVVKDGKHTRGHSIGKDEIKEARDGNDGDEDAGVRERKELVDLGNGMEEVIVVEWEKDDPGNPFNWSRSQKYTQVLTAVFITACTAMNCTSVAIMGTWGPDRFGVARELFNLSLTVMMISIAFTPMILAPLSEVFGRNAIYQVTSIINALLFIPQALSPSYAGLLVARWFQGMASSVGNSMVGGTVADLFHADSRGLAMNVFSIVIFAGQAMGGIVNGWVGMNLGIQWCYAIMGFIGALSCVLNALFLRETRGDVLLSRRAKKLTKETGVLHICAADLQKKDFSTVIRVSLVRPFVYLATEPIVTALSAWIGFAWSIIFLGGTSELLVFREYGFNDGEAGSVQTVVFIGGILGFISNYHQEYLYDRSAVRNGGRAPPEARLYWAAFGGLLFPLATFVFAWTGRPEVPWIVPAIMLCISNWGVYCMYSGIFNYLADAYETYSSSAQAAHSFVRNISSGVFPLFARQLYVTMGYPQASTLVASIATVLAAAPILILYYGKQLRARSKVASALERDGAYR